MNFYSESEILIPNATLLSHSERMRGRIHHFLFKELIVVSLSSENKSAFLLKKNWTFFLNLKHFNL